MVGRSFANGCGEMPRFIKGDDLTPEQRKGVVEQTRDFRLIEYPGGGPTCASDGRVEEEYLAKHGRRRRGTVGKITDQLAPPDEIAYILTKRAYCFTNDGKYRTNYAGHSWIAADAADGQNARLIELEAARKAKRLLHTKRKVGQI